jgi:hypothetical protein
LIAAKRFVLLVVMDHAGSVVRGPQLGKFRLEFVKGVFGVSVAAAAQVHPFPALFGEMPKGVFQQKIAGFCFTGNIGASGKVLVAKPGRGRKINSDGNGLIFFFRDPALDPRLRHQSLVVT